MTNELRELDDLRVPDDLWDRARRRVPGAVPERGRRRGPAIITAAVASIVSVWLVLATFAGVDRTEGPPSPHATPEAPRSFDGWSVSVTAMRSRVGPLLLSVGPVIASKRQGWVEHALTIENVGDRAVTLEDSRSAAFVGSKRLFVADWSCGYASSGPGARVHAGACLLYLDTHLLRPGDRLVRSVSLQKELPGMRPLRSGTYVFEQPVRYTAKGGRLRSESVPLAYAVGRVPPLSFAPAEEWFQRVELGHGTTPAQAWASNQPFPASVRPPALPSDEAWLEDDGVLLIAWEVTFDLPDPVHDGNFPDVEGAIPLAEPSVGYEGQSSPDVSRSQMFVAANGRRLQVRVYFGSAHPSDEALAAAQAELARLIVSEPDRLAS
jgi:hypothetical protein